MPLAHRLSTVVLGEGGRCYDKAQVDRVFDNLSTQEVKGGYANREVDELLAPFRRRKQDEFWDLLDLLG